MYLNFVEVQSCFKRYNIVSGNSCDRLVTWVSGRVECQCCLSWYQLRGGGGKGGGGGGGRGGGGGEGEGGRHCNAVPPLSLSVVV